MARIRISMRASVGFIVLLMGILGVLLAVTTGNVYQRFVLDNQRVIFEELADIKIGLILSDTIQRASDLGMSIQANSELRKAYRNRDAARINALLHDQFHQFLVSTSLLKLQQAYVLDKNFTVVGYADDEDGNLSLQAVPCEGLLQQARAREGYDRLKILSGLCTSSQGGRVAVIVPLGGLRLEGYLMVDIDPTPNLAHVEEEMSMPLRLVGGDGRVAYVSEEWQGLSGRDDLLYWTYTLPGMDALPAYQFHFAADMSGLYAKLDETRHVMFIVAALSTLLVAVISVMMLQKTTVDPIASLTYHLRRVRKDKKYLGEKVHVKGSQEITELSERFNEMSSELHVLYKTLERMAYTDMLTRLPNRTVFYDRLGQAVHMAQRQKIPFALMVMDLNRFKWVNDNLGHHIGDKLLKEIAARLQRCMRRSDTVARLGGDEFAALLPGIAGHGDSRLMAEKIVDHIARPLVIDGHSLPCGVSIGIAHCPEHGVDGDILVQRADVAMYFAKKQRRGFMTYEESLDEHSLNHLDLEKELDAAIDSGHLEIHYQPKFDLQNGKVIDMEALIRWRHPQRGYLFPDQFIPQLEQCNLEHKLVRWIFSRVLGDCAEWHEKAYMIGVSVNVSRRSLADSRIYDLVRTSLEMNGIDPAWLSLEISESMMLSDAEQSLNILDRFHELGIRLSVDHFGCGHFSLAGLERMPLGEVKIDQYFIQKMQSGNSESVIVRSMIDLAHNLGLKAVAKGVESSRVRDLLVELDCDYAQGNLFCVPCGKAEITGWLEGKLSQDHQRISNLPP